MNKHVCHFCEELTCLIILVKGGGVCPKCLKNLYLNEKPLPKTILKKLKPVTKFDSHIPLDMMQALLISWFLKSGTTVSNISRQLGITRATVYAKLRKYELWQPDEDLKLNINPTTADLLGSGHVKEVKCNHAKPDKI